MTTTVIRNAAWVIAWDAGAQQHSFLTDADVAFTGDTLTWVGRNHEGPVDVEVDGRDLMVMPGLIDIHSHPNSESSYRGLREEHGVKSMWMTGLYERSCALSPTDAEAKIAGCEVSMCEMLKSGVTTITDLSFPYEGWIDLMARSGLRAVLAPGYASAGWKLENDWTLGFAWDKQAGKSAFDHALKMIEEIEAHPCGRLSGMVYPAQIETVTPELMQDSITAAKERNLPITTHAAQSVLEFQEIVRRTGMTPLAYSESIGLLGPNLVLGHCIFIDENSWVRWWSRDDIGRLVDSGTSVAHCPTPFARYGQILEDFGKYRRAGVNLGIGTDTTPHNIIEEMRKAATFARIAARDISTVGIGDFFHAATIGGSRALLRDDIGRLAPGAKADVVLVDLKNVWMQPARDPLRSLIYHAADRAVRDVYVDGKQVVRAGEVLTINHADACERLTEAQQRMMAACRQRDFKGRTADEIMPLSLPMMS